MLHCVFINSSTHVCFFTCLSRKSIDVFFQFVSSDKWSLGWGWLAWLGLSVHTLYFRCFDSVELITDHTYLDTIVTILLSHSWLDSYEFLTVYLQFDSYEPGTAIAAFNTSLFRTNFKQKFELGTAIAAFILFSSNFKQKFELDTAIAAFILFSSNFKQEFEPDTAIAAYNQIKFQAGIWARYSDSCFNTSCWFTSTVMIRFKSVYCMWSLLLNDDTRFHSIYDLMIYK